MQVEMDHDHKEPSLEDSKSANEVQAPAMSASLHQSVDIADSPAENISSLFTIICAGELKLYSHHNGGARIVVTDIGFHVRFCSDVGL